MSKLRWGILGCGSIANKFATGLQAIDDAELVAVGSRSQDKADEFGAKYDAAHCHGSYDDLVADDDVDIIYVATPHTHHKDCSILCLEGGKHVLCEKPFTVNAQQAQELVDVARTRELFLMEAMWMRFNPVMVKVRELLAENAIGDVRLVEADFAFRAGFNPESRLLNPELAGGGLLDVGIYPISFTTMVYQDLPTEVSGFASIGETGVDEQAVITMIFPEDALAMMACGVRTSTKHQAVIYGTDGRIEVHAPFWNSRGLTVVAGGETQELDIEVKGNGYNYQAEECARCLEAGKLESDIMPLDESIQLVGVMDKLRRDWGITYPCEA